MLATGTIILVTLAMLFIFLGGNWEKKEGNFLSYLILCMVASPFYIIPSWFAYFVFSRRGSGFEWLQFILAATFLVFVVSIQLYTFRKDRKVDHWQDEETLLWKIEHYFMGGHEE